ncbi:MAG: hypothetical protein AAF806_08310 [Bacteroidota bacterium]
MKYLFLLFTIVGFVLPTQAQREKVYPFTKVIQPTAFYTQQAQLWKAAVEQNKKDGDAWYNYYCAARMTNAKTKETAYDLNGIVAEVLENIPNTFESEFIQFWNGNWSAENQAQLKRAHQIAPERTEAYRDLMAIYIKEGNEEKAKEFARKFFEEDKYSRGLVNWSYNQLMSVEDGGILLTNGDNDTFFAWMVQYHHGVKPNIAIASSWLLTLKDFQASFFKKIDVPAFPKTAENFANRNEHRLAVVDHIIKHSNRPVYLGVGFEQEERYQSKLYQVGLAYRYSATHFDNFAILRNNIENNFLIDYLQQEMQPDFGVSVTHQMNQFYISPFLMLYNHYKQSGELGKAVRLKKIIQKVAAQGQNAKHIEEYLANLE